MCSGYFFFVTEVYLTIDKHKLKCGKLEIKKKKKNGLYIQKPLLYLKKLTFLTVYFCPKAYCNRSGPKGYHKPVNTSTIQAFQAYE